MPLTPPTEADVLAMLTFSPEDGRIWFNHRRMMMLDTVSFATLRDSLIRHLGMRPARALLTQVGYQSGVSDANMLRRDWPDDYRERSRIGTRFHGVAGIAKVEPVRTDFRPREGYFEGEFLWRHTVEDDAHIRTQGLGTEPACWMELGYATGYLSTICDRLIVFREFECRSMGSAVCRVRGRPAEEWDDVAEDLSYLGLDEAALRQGAGRARPRAQAGAAQTGKTAGARGTQAPSPPSLAPPGADGSVVGDSAALRSASILLGKVAATLATVLITGESGTGKELFARVLHARSARAKGPFVAVNCAAIPENLIESELFGVARGGFTGAVQDRAGRFERAAGGTLFLDEIGTLSLAAQAKLLRALQEQEIERVGATRTTRVDARIVAATNVSLREAVARGEFREDLFYRLNVFPIHLPPLRERRDDIPALVAHFIARYNALHGKAVSRLTPRASEALLNHRFPGNIRELENLIERALILSDDDSIDLPHLNSGGTVLDTPVYRFDANGRVVSGARAGTAAANHAGTGGGLVTAWAEQLLDACAPDAGLDMTALQGAALDEAARLALQRCAGNVAAAARMLGMKRHQLEYRLKRGDARPASASQAS